MKVQIVGAGSSGCHMARACIREGYSVSIWDTDINARYRFKDLYFERYGVEAKVKFEMAYDADLYIISTPPASHMPIAYTIKYGSKVLIEKPVCLATEINQHLMGDISVNYNHLYATEYLKLQAMKQPDEIEVCWQESINYIMQAHPWLRFEDSYLSDHRKGGGSAYEHSHGLAAALGLFPDVSMDEIERLKSEKRMKGMYDEYMKIRFLCRGTLVTVTTDFTSVPAKKEIKFKYGNEFITTNIITESREDQFLYGLRGALKQNDSYRIGKLAVEIISLCHQSS